VRHAMFREICGVSGEHGESMGYSGEPAVSSGVFVGCCGVYLVLTEPSSSATAGSDAVVVQIVMEPAAVSWTSDQTLAIIREATGAGSHPYPPALARSAPRERFIQAMIQGA
jgi:hypothetical protein